MKKLTCLLVTILAFSLCNPAKATFDASPVLWEKTFGGSKWDCYWGNSFQQTTDGGYIIAGHTYPCAYDDDDSDVYLIKTDSEGNLLWQKTIGGSNGGDMAHSVQQTTDGGYIIAGWTRSFGAGWDDVYLIKLGFEGCERWDLNCDKTVDFADFAQFAQHWLEGSKP